mmetsp:Transcript_34525/g.86727  ORF Transcript_34525/g.86727 Transcript_34525/m.86727 type:complete len:476 (-) Transcript_34525:821-2248(-)
MSQPALARASNFPSSMLVGEASTYWSSASRQRTSSCSASRWTTLSPWMKQQETGYKRSDTWPPPPMLFLWASEATRARRPRATTPLSRPTAAAMLPPACPRPTLKRPAAAATPCRPCSATRWSGRWPASRGLTAATSALTAASRLCACPPHALWCRPLPHAPPLCSRRRRRLTPSCSIAGATGAPPHCWLSTWTASAASRHTSRRTQCRPSTNPTAAHGGASLPTCFILPLARKQRSHRATKTRASSLDLIPCWILAGVGCPSIWATPPFTARCQHLLLTPRPAARPTAPPAASAARPCPPPVMPVCHPPAPCPAPRSRPARTLPKGGGSRAPSPRACPLPRPCCPQAGRRSRRRRRRRPWPVRVRPRPRELRPQGLRHGETCFRWLQALRRPGQSDPCSPQQLLAARRTRRSRRRRRRRRYRRLARIVLVPNCRARIVHVAAWWCGLSSRCKTPQCRLPGRWPTRTPARSAAQR